MQANRGRVHRSVSTWQQPTPPPTSPTRTALINDIVDRIRTLGTHRLRVAVDGRTASGKTSFGHELAERIAQKGRPVLRASLDDYKKPWKDRHRYDRESGEGYYRNAFDYQATTRHLLDPAGPRGSGACALCYIDPLTQVDHSSMITQAAPDAVLIVDGVFAFRPDINNYWDYRIWLDIDPDQSIQRGTDRDEAWAGSDAEAIHRTRYHVAENIYIAEVDPVNLADVVIDNNVFQQPRMINNRGRTRPES